MILILDSCCKQRGLVYQIHQNHNCQAEQSFFKATGEVQVEPLWELDLFVRVRDAQVYCITVFQLLQMSFCRI